MFRPIAAIPILVGLGVTGTPAGAVDEQTPECFCLRHRASGSVVHFGCESRIVGHRATPETTCLGTDRKAKVPVRSMDGFEKLGDGAEGCEPCVPEFRCRNEEGKEAGCQESVRNGEGGRGQ